ncbi:hypothetical protein BC629DRAFT_2851 [Irpex lacteus]|nr:hypothetical protein BC629DRAFT_2851 [Irpex lacteus]
MSHFFSNLLASGSRTSFSDEEKGMGKVGLPLSDEEVATAGLLPSSERAEFRIEGMTCGACVESIESMLRGQEGIHSIKVALLAERAVVEYDPAKWTEDKIMSVSVPICQLSHAPFPSIIGVPAYATFILHSS